MKFVSLLLAMLLFVECSYALKPRLQMQKGDYLIVNNPNYDPGFFSVFSSVLGALEVYDTGEYSGIFVNLNSGRYLDTNRGPNWWEYFFEPIKLGKIDPPTKKYIFHQDLADFSFAILQIPRQRLHYLINKYVRVKKDIQKQINTYVKNKFAGHFVIGVHHRGTDKQQEQVPIPYEMTYDALCKAIDNLDEENKNNFLIYVATDDSAFLTYMSERFPSRIIYSDFVRSSNEIPLHFGDFYKNNYERGKEALLDCLLLSKCNMLLRPWSNLSLAATFFNPEMPVVVLTHPEGIFFVKNFLNRGRISLKKFSNANYPNPYPEY